MHVGMSKWRELQISKRKVESHVYIKYTCTILVTVDTHYNTLLLAPRSDCLIVKESIINLATSFIVGAISVYISQINF